MKRSREHNKVKFGSTFSAESQSIDVNVHAEGGIDPDLWKRGTATVGFGEKWYYAKIPLDHDSFSEEEYLIRDEVGSDGWGGIDIFRNIEWIADDQANIIPTIKMNGW